jgi:hypothetical protein
MQPGTCDFLLRKPFSVRKLVGLIEHLLGGSTRSPDQT